MDRTTSAADRTLWGAGLPGTPGQAGRPLPVPPLATLAGFGLLLLWVYWPAFAAMAHQWTYNPQYSHGYLVPAFALYLLWKRRQQLANVSAGLNGGGLLLLAAATALRLAGSFFFLP